MAEIGVQISSVRDYLQDADGVLESFRKVSQMGYRHIQIQWVNPDVSDDVIYRALRENGLHSLGTQDFYDVVLSSWERTVQQSKMWNSDYICVSGIPERFRSFNGCLKLARELTDRAEELAIIGKKLLFHPRSEDFQTYDGELSLDILLNNTPDDVQICLDAYQFVKAGHSVADWLYRLDGRMDILHAKDYAEDSDGEHYLVPAGQGLQDWNSIIEACNETNVLYVLTEQETWRKEPFESLKEGYQFLYRKVF